MTPTAWTYKLVSRLREETTPRTLAGVVALVLILAVVGLSELATKVTTLRQDVYELQRDRSVQAALLADDGWVERSELAERSVVQTRARFWTGATAGIVVAQLQGEVEAAGRRANLQNMRVNVQADPSSLGQHAVVFEISLTARDTQGQFLAFFQEAVRSEGYLIPTSFEWSRLNGNVSIRLEAPAVVGSTDDGASDGTPS